MDIKTPCYEIKNEDADQSEPMTSHSAESTIGLRGHRVRFRQCNFTCRELWNSQTESCILSMRCVEIIFISWGQQDIFSEPATFNDMQSPSQHMMTNKTLI